MALSLVTAGTMTLCPLAEGAEDAPRIRVEYDAPRLSVAATEVSLDELLRAIGAKVGFTVAAGTVASAAVTVSIAGASVDDALRQLLRAENHTILYRQGANAVVMVDRVVLLGAPGDGDSASHRGARPDQEASAAAASASPVEASPYAAAPGEVLASPRPGEGAADEQPASVGDMLRSHALAGLPAQPSGVTESVPPAVPASLEESLAITTQRAQQGLTSLVEGLQRATQSLQQPAAAPAAGR